MSRSLPSPLRVLTIGGTSGIGRAIALSLAQLPSSRVTIVGRNASAGAAITSEHPNTEFLQADVSLMSEVKRVAEEFKERLQEGEELDFLVMSQGVLSLGGRTPTAEGLDNKLALHYYGRALFIRELLPVLSSHARVLSVFDGKSGHPSRINWDDLALERTYSLSTAAAHAITFNDIIIQHFAALSPSISFVHARPGAVRTSLGDSLPWYARLPAKGLMAVLGTDADVCAERMIEGTCQIAGGWACIDDKGRKIDKEAVSEDVRDKIAAHTWEIVDAQA